MPDPKILVIGHSHVNCIASVYRQMGRPPWLKVFNLRRIDKTGGIVDSIRGLIEGFEPDALCLCLRGNLHNVIGMVEHPQPFSVGGVPCPGEGRQVIPYALMRAHFRQVAHPELMACLFAAFPRADRLVLNAPPPVADFDHLRKHPGIFAESIAQGPAPEGLRLFLFALQTDVVRDLAAEHGARFVQSPDRVLDQAGFLASRYFDDDPTHGNDAYGREMLAELRNAVGVPA